ncbi:hypothetical protein P9112_004927 [Eukaryota sp. TZLM1-RC]
MPGHIALNCPPHNNNVQNHDATRSTNVHSVIELEKVNTVLCVVNEVVTNTCSKSRLGDVLTVHDNDSPNEEPFEVVLNPLTKNLPSSKRRGEEGVLLDVG